MITNFIAMGQTQAKLLVETLDVCIRPLFALIYVCVSYEHLLYPTIMIIPMAIARS